MSTGPLRAPEPLAPDHDLDLFDCGVGPLDAWLKQRARRNEDDGASRTFVCCVGRQAIGYYSLAASSILHAEALGKVRRNMPEPIPALLIGRLAIDATRQGEGLGADLLRDAVRRCVAAAATIGVRVIVVNAISDQAKRFYERFGFRPSPIAPMTLMITIEEARRRMEVP